MNELNSFETCADIFAVKVSSLLNVLIRKELDSLMPSDWCTNTFA